MKNYKSRSHNVEKLLAAPLLAAVSANAEMQKHQAKFLMETAFEKKEDTYKPVIIEMELINHVQSNQETENGEPLFTEVRSVFALPLLTILPISSLGVDTVKINFDMEITEQRSSSYDPSTSIKGKVSHDANETSNNKNQKRSVLKVDMEANSLPLPVGVTTLIDLYQKSIHPKKQNNNDI